MIELDPFDSRLDRRRVRLLPQPTRNRPARHPAAHPTAMFPLGMEKDDVRVEPTKQYPLQALRQEPDGPLEDVVAWIDLPKLTGAVAQRQRTASRIEGRAQIQIDPNRSGLDGRAFGNRNDRVAGRFVEVRFNRRNAPETGRINGHSPPFRWYQPKVTSSLGRNFDLKCWRLIGYRPVAVAEDRNLTIAHRSLACLTLRRLANAIVARS